MDEFNQHLAGFQQALLDLDGDGVPDVALPVQPPRNALSRQTGPQGRALTASDMPYRIPQGPDGHIRSPSEIDQYRSLAHKRPPPQNALRPQGPQLSKYTPSTAEWIGNQFGDAMEYLGMPRYIAQKYGGKAETAAGLTGLPMMVDGARNVQHGIEKRDWAKGAHGAGQIALGALPGGALTRTGRKAISGMMQTPVRAMAFGAATSVPGAILGTREAMAAQGDLESRLRSMSRDELRAFQNTIGAFPDGVYGVKTLAKAQQHEAKGDNAAKIEAARIKALAEADIARKEAAERAKQRQKAIDAKTPFRDLYPQVMPWLPVAAAVGSMGLGSVVRGSAGRVFNEKMADLSRRWKGAVQSGNQRLANSLQGEFQAVQRTGPGGHLAAPALGAGFGAEMAILPEEIDLWRGVPGAWERATDIEAMGKRAVVGGLIGGVSAHTGAALRGAAKSQNRYHKGYASETEGMGMPNHLSSPAPAYPRSPGPPFTIPQRAKIKEAYESIRSSKGGASKTIVPADVVGNMKGKSLTDSNVSQYIKELDEVYKAIGLARFSKIKNALKSVAPPVVGAGVVYNSLTPRDH